MKILLVSNSLTHYYNRVLSKLNDDPDIDLTVVVPGNGSQSVGAGVYQATEGINFKVVEVSEKLLFGKIPHLSGLADVLINVAPDVVILVVEYSLLLALDLRLRRAIRKIGCKVIIKSIPFRIEAFDARLRAIAGANGKQQGMSRFSVWRWIRTAKVYVDRYIYCSADAHLNYIDAKDMWASYGVPAEKVFVSGNSPDTDKLLEVSDELGDVSATTAFNPFRIVHVGRLVAWKRVDLLLQAFRILKDKFPRAELIVVGDGPELESLKQQAMQLEVDHSVTFRGAIYDPRELGSALKACSVYVLAGMGGLSINDAMCFGLPIVCSVCDGTEAALVHEGINGTYFKEGDCADLVERISELLRNPELSREMGRHSVDIIRERVNVRRVLDEYKRAFYFVCSYPAA
ncbi:MAG: glycosyltransferase family 4 protein [Rhizobacter sp.]